MVATDDYARLFADLDEAYRAGDARRVAALSTPDAIISPIDLADIFGRAAIEAALTQFFAIAKVHEYRFVVNEADPCERAAHVRGTYRWRSTLADGKALDTDGRYAAMLKQTAEGWRLHRLLENRLP